MAGTRLAPSLLLYFLPNVLYFLLQGLPCFCQEYWGYAPVIRIVLPHHQTCFS